MKSKPFKADGWSRLQLPPRRANSPRDARAHWDHEPEQRSAGWQPAVSPTQAAPEALPRRAGSRQPFGYGTPADCQSVPPRRKQTVSLRYGSRPASTAFTLIELLVVISIIAILAGFILPTAGAVKKARMIKVAQAELSQMQAAIEAYKARLGFYPPDNPVNYGAVTMVNAVTNPLYFELAGTLFTNITGKDYYVTLDGTAQLPATQASFDALFGGGGNTSLSGFMNSSKNARGGDEGSAAINFLSAGLKPNQVGVLDVVGGRILACSVQWADGSTAPISLAAASIQPPYLNPWRYVSSTPTNNAGSYDLWVDIPIGGKIYRVSNWSKQPQPF